MCQKNAIFVTTGVLKMLVKYKPYLCNGCHDLMQKVMSFNDMAVAFAKGNANRINFWHISNNDAINIMNDSNLVDKKGVL